MRARAWVLALASATALPSPLTRSEDAPWVQHRSASDTLCTAEGADPFKYGPAPNPAIPCCKGLTQSSEPLPQGYPGARAGDKSIVCRRIHRHFSAGAGSVELVEQPATTTTTTTTTVVVVENASAPMIDSTPLSPHPAPSPYTSLTAVAVQPVTVEPPVTVKPVTPSLGGSRDEHGCNPSGGYAWCAVLGRCVQPWLTPCDSSGVVPPAPIPVWYGRGSATTWPPLCTPEGADKFQYAAPPDPGIACCEGLVACAELRPSDYLGYNVAGFDVVFACRPLESCVAKRPTPWPAATGSSAATQLAHVARPVTGQCAMPPMYGIGAAAAWPPACTAEGADKFQYGLHLASSKEGVVTKVGPHPNPSPNPYLTLTLTSPYPWPSPSPSPQPQP